MSVRPAAPAAVTAVTAEEMAVLRQSLQSCRRERLEQLALLGDESAPNHDPVAAAHRDSVRRILADVEAALTRMDAGTYGLCADCATAIPFARLEVLPYATACVRCLNRRAETW